MTQFSTPLRAQTGPGSSSSKNAGFASRLGNPRAIGCDQLRLISEVAQVSAAGELGRSRRQRGKHLAMNSSGVPEASASNTKSSLQQYMAKFNLLFPES